MKLDGGALKKYHDVVVFAGVLGAITYVPIPLGSNRPFAWYGLELFVYGLLAFRMLGLIVYAERAPVPSQVRTILIVLLIWLGFVFLQTVPLPASLVRALNPLVYKLQQNLALINIHADNTLSIDPGTTYDEFLKYGCYVALLYLTLATVNTNRRLLWIIGAIVAAGILEAGFGLYCKSAGFVIFPETHVMHEPRAGTFVNHDHYANLLLMILGLVFGVVASVVNAQKPVDRLKLQHYGFRHAGVLLLTGAVVLILLAAIFVSGSVVPVVFFSIAFGIVLLGLWRLHCVEAGEFLLAPVVILALMLAITLMGVDDGVRHLVGGDLLGREHVLQDVSGLKLLGSVWATGVGAGNYRWIFPMFRSSNLSFVTYDHAHNDYLEVLIGQGLPVAAILGLAVYLVLRQLYKGCRRRRNPLMRGVIFGSLISVIFMLLHATDGFSFHIPANSVYFFVIAGVGLSACRIDRGKRAMNRASGSSGTS